MATRFSITSSTPTSKESILGCLKAHLTECMRLRREGTARSRIAYEQGYVDGVMRSLLDAGLATEKELLDFVADLRRQVDGPAAREVLLSAPEESLGWASSAR